MYPREHNLWNWCQYFSTNSFHIAQISTCFGRRRGNNWRTATIPSSVGKAREATIGTAMDLNLLYYRQNTNIRQIKSDKNMILYYFTATQPIQILQQLHGRRKLYYYVVINNEHTHHSYVWIPHVVISWDINCIYIQFDSCSNRRRQCMYLWKNEIGT